MRTHLEEQLILIENMEPIMLERILMSLKESIKIVMILPKLV
jgi:hypothetical protein